MLGKCCAVWVITMVGIGTAAYGDCRDGCGCHSHCKPAPRGEVLMSGPPLRFTDERVVRVREDAEKELQMKVDLVPRAPDTRREGERQRDCAYGNGNLDKRVADIERALLRLTHLLNQLDLPQRPQN